MTAQTAFGMPDKRHPLVAKVESARSMIFEARDQGRCDFCGFKKGCRRILVEELISVGKEPAVPADEAGSVFLSAASLAEGAGLTGHMQDAAYHMLVTAKREGCTAFAEQTAAAYGVKLTLEELRRL